MSKENNDVKSRGKLDQILDVLTMVGGKLGSNRQLSNLRDSFATFMPFVIMGSLAILINSLIIQPGSIIAGWSGADSGSVLTGGDGTPNALYVSWSNFAFYVEPIFSGITGATTQSMALFMAFFLGYYGLKSYGNEKPLFGGAITLAVFLALQPIQAGVALGAGASYGNAARFLGSGGLIEAIFAGLVAPLVYHKLTLVEAFKIKMPDGVPPAIGNAFGALIPVGIMLFTFGLIQPIWGAIIYAAGPGQLDGAIDPSVYYIFNAIEKWIAEPFMDLGATIWAVIIIAFLVSLLWFVGLHGSNIMSPVIQTLWLPLLIQNMDILNNTYGGNMQLALDSGTLNTWTMATASTFLTVGGGGYALALLIPLTFASRLPHAKAIARLALPPSAFNISEPVVYGLPIMLNMFYIIPFLFVAPIISVFAYLFTAWGWMNPAVAYAAWMMPGVILAPVITTLDWRAGVYSVVFLIGGCFAYLPFVILESRVTIKEEAAAAGISEQEFLAKANEQINADKEARKAAKLAKAEENAAKKSNKDSK